MGGGIAASTHGTEVDMSQRHQRARDDFERAFRRGKLSSLLAELCRRPSHLRSYREARRCLVVTGESDRGICSVPVERIVGSTDRPRDFDTAFRPLRSHAASRWVRVALAQGEGRELPPVQLYQIADAYFVRDGHHRVSVARARGQAWIDAEVVEVIAYAPRPTYPGPDVSSAPAATRAKRSVLAALHGVGIT
jgi:hypothetical protein